MTKLATITFISQDKRVSQPIPVPRWSKVTLTLHPEQPTIYMGTDKVVLYSGPYQVNGKGYEAPVMHRMPTRTRVMTPVLHPGRTARKRRARTVAVPVWLVFTAVALLYALYGVVLWFLIP